MCFTCPNNTYTLEKPSLENNGICLPCPDNMICLGGSQLYPQPGYYWNNDGSTIATECLNRQAC